MPEHQPDSQAAEAEPVIATANAIPATPPAITQARAAFEQAVRAWHCDEGSPSEVGRLLTALLVAEDTPYLDEVPYPVRSLFTQFRRQHQTTVTRAVDLARTTILPATASKELPPHLPVRMDESFREGAD